jgi:hypothetical protein
VFVYGLHRQLHDQIRFTSQLPFGSGISDKEVSLMALFTRIFWIPPPHEPALFATRRCINDFSAPSNANVWTGLEMNIGDGSFEPKPALINMVQQSPFCSKSSEDANAHLQHFLEICSTFNIRGVN